MLGGLAVAPEFGSAEVVQNILVLSRNNLSLRGAKRRGNPQPGGTRGCDCQKPEDRLATLMKAPSGRIHCCTHGPAGHPARSSGSFHQSSPKFCANHADNIGRVQGSCCGASVGPNDPAATRPSQEPYAHKLENNMHTFVVAFGALVIAAVAGVLLAPSEVSVKRPFLPAQCVTPRLAPVVRCLGRRRPS